MKLISYREALKKGKEAVDQLMIPSRVNKARKKAELKLAELDEEIATTRVKLQDACLATDELDFDAIMDIQDDLALLDRQHGQLTDILDQMFNDTDEDK